MNTNFKPHLFVFTTVIVAFLPFFSGQCFGEDYYVDLTGEVSVWDLSGTYTDTSLGFPVSYTISQDPRGRLTGSGSVTGTLDGASIDTEYDIRGSVRQSRGVISVRLTIRFQGTATSGEEPIRFSASERISAEVNSSQGTLDGMANVSTRVGRSSTREEVPIAWDLPADMDGSCEILFNANTDGRRLAGDGQLALSNGSVYGMDVSGRINERNNEGSFRLRGTGAARGFNINVTTSTGTDAVKAVSGRGLGQRLEAEDLAATSNEASDPADNSPPYTLAVSTVNGSVQVTPEKDTYQQGEVVQLIPTPAGGYSFRKWSGDASGKRLVQKVTMDSDKSITANFGTWEPPIGIPEPNFGITETYRMYDNPANRNPNLTYTQNAEGGYYTHYVDNTSPNATDTDNDYGSPDTPRLTPPFGAPEGSVVEIHGGPYTHEVRSENFNYNKRLPLKAFGTAAKPVFFRGGSTPAPILIGYDNRTIMVEGTYIIVECLEMQNTTRIWPFGFDRDRTHHVAIRNCEMTSPGTRDHGVDVGWPHGDYEFYQDPNLIHDVIVYGNRIYNLGELDWSVYEAGEDPGDSYGVYAHHNAYQTWVIDNHIYGIDGGGIHINTYHIDDDTQYPPTKTYVGRNVIHKCREVCLGSKVCWDTISSQNIFYGIHESIGGIATGLVVEADHETPKYQYQERAWHLFNEIYDCDRGIRTHDSKEVYFIGNVIRDIISVDELTDGPWSSGCAIQGWRTWDVHIINNTIYNCDLGILDPGNRDYSEVHMANNIIYELTDNFYDQFSKQPYQVYIGTGSGANERSTDNNNLYYQNGDALALSWGAVYNSVSAFQAGTGKGAGSMESNPRFSSLDSVDSGFLRPISASPAIDAGTSSGSVQDAFDRFQTLYGIDLRKDIEGTSRPQGSGWDIGAYE